MGALFLKLFFMLYYAHAGMVVELKGKVISLSDNLYKVESNGRYYFIKKDLLSEKLIKKLNFSGNKIQAKIPIQSIHSIKDK